MKGCDITTVLAGMIICGGKMSLMRADTEFIGGGNGINYNHSKQMTLHIITEFLDTAVETAAAEVHMENQGKARRAMINLTPEQRAHKFFADRATEPADVKLCVCARCRHCGTVDEPNGSLEKIKKNTEKILVWQEVREEFKQAKENGTADRID